MAAARCGCEENDEGSAGGGRSGDKVRKSCSQSDGGMLMTYEVH